MKLQVYFRHIIVFYLVHIVNMSKVQMYFSRQALLNFTAVNFRRMLRPADTVPGGNDDKGMLINDEIRTANSFGVRLEMFEPPHERPQKHPKECKVNRHCP